MTPSRMQEFGREALSGALQWPPGRAGGGAHEMNFNGFVASLCAHDQRAAPLPVMRAGPADHFPRRQGAISKDPGTAVSSLVNTSGRQPSRIHGGLFLTRGAIDAALNFGLTTRNQPASYPRRECPERRPVIGSLHAHNMERTNGEGVAVEYVNQRRGA